MLNIILVASLLAGVGNTPPARRGVALGLFHADPAHDYRPLLDELAAQGARHVSLVTVGVQPDIRTPEITLRDGFSVKTENLVNTIREAGARGMDVMVFPILRIHAREKGEWRGKMAFPDRARADTWWHAYTRFILEQARAAQAGGASRFCVGSELLLLEKERARWEALIRAVRGVFRGRITYSANWDHYEKVTFWDLLDDVGMTAYFEVGTATDRSAAQLEGAWDRALAQVGDFSRRTGRPVVITEVGYPSLQESTRYPWDETRRAPLDLDEQRRGYAAFFSAVARAPWVEGAYTWNWYGTGGTADGDYTPRGKPALRELRHWLRGG